MATPTTIATGIMTTLDNNINDIDYASVSSFLPAIQTQSVALLVVPFDNETMGQAETFAATEIWLTHRITCEFWVKHTPGNEATTAQRARDICTTAIEVLLENNNTGGYGIDYSEPFVARVAPGIEQIHNTNWIVAALTVPVENKVPLG